MTVSISLKRYIEKEHRRISFFLGQRLDSHQSSSYPGSRRSSTNASEVQESDDNFWLDQVRVSFFFEDEMDLIHISLLNVLETENNLCLVTKRTYYGRTER